MFHIVFLVAIATACISLTRRKSTAAQFAPEGPSSVARGGSPGECESASIVRPGGAGVAPLHRLRRPLRGGNITGLLRPGLPPRATDDGPSGANSTTIPRSPRLHGKPFCETLTPALPLRIVPVVVMAWSQSVDSVVGDSRVPARSAFERSSIERMQRWLITEWAGRTRNDL